MSAQYRFSRDVKQALTMAQSLEEYVRGDRLYGQTGAGALAGMPSMTVGGMLMRLRRLDVLRDHLKDHQIKNLDKAIEQYDAVRHEWAFHYEGKITREAHSRIDAMKGFFYECADNIRQCIGIYKPEMTRRTIVQELLKEMQVLDMSDATLMTKIEETDEKLKRYVEQAAFQWSDVLMPAFPKAEYWWLYCSPPNLP